MKNLANMASELLEFEDEDDGTTPASTNGIITPIGESNSHKGYKRSSPETSLNSIERKELMNIGFSKFSTHNISNLSCHTNESQIVQSLAIYFL